MLFLELNTLNTIMKKTLALVIILTATSVAMYGQFTHAGLAGGYGLSIKEPGFGLYGMYTANEQVKIVPSVMYFLPHEIVTSDGTQNFSWWIFNLDGNYIVLDQVAFQAYGLMGLSVVYLKGEQDEPPFQDIKYQYKMGLNVGAGIRLPISDKVAPFAELKLTLGDEAYFSYRKISTTQLSITAGILIRIAPDKVRDTEEY
jgi:hypothetical protein